MHIASEPFPLNQLGLQSQLDALAAVGPEQAFMMTDLGDAIRVDAMSGEQIACEFGLCLLLPLELEAKESSQKRKREEDESDSNQSLVGDTLISGDQH